MLLAVPAPERVVIRYWTHDLRAIEGRAALDEWLVVGKLDRLIEVDVKKALDWEVEQLAKQASTASKSKKQVNLTGGELVDDILAAAAKVKAIGRRPVDPEDLSTSGGALLEEFKVLLEASDDEGEEASADAPAPVALPPPDLPAPVAWDPAFDLDVDVLISDASLGSGSGSGASGSGVSAKSAHAVAALAQASAQPAPGASSSSSGSGAGPEDEMAQTLDRLKLRVPSLNFPRDVLSVASDEPVPVGRLYFVWGRTYKAVCRRHPKCSLMINTKWCSNAAEAERVSYEWLSHALQTTEQQHFVEAYRIVEARKPGGKPGKP